MSLLFFQKTPTLGNHWPPMMKSRFQPLRAMEIGNLSWKER